MGYPLAEDTLSIFPKLMSFDEFVADSSVDMFPHWLPMYLNEDYFVKGWSMLEKTLLLLSNRQFQQETTHFAALRIFPKILNRLGMDMMTYAQNNVPPEGMVQAYSHVLRLFTRILDDGEMWGEVDETIRSFFACPEGCSISMGELMVLLSLSKKFSFWGNANVKRCVLNEFFIRKAEMEGYQGLTGNNKGQEGGKRLRREELRGKIAREMEWVEPKFNHVHTFVISNYGDWRRSISSPSSRPAPFSVVSTKGTDGLEWEVSSSKKKAILKLIRGFETWGVDWELGVELFVGSWGTGDSTGVVVRAKNRVVDVTQDVLRMLERKGDREFVVVEVKATKVTSSIHEDRRKREMEKRYKMELQEDLRKLKEVKKEKTTSLEGQLRAHFEATAVANKAMMFGALAPQWFLQEGANEILDGNLGVPPQKVMEGVVGLVEMIRGVRGYEEFFRALKFENKVRGREEVGKFIREAELVGGRR